MPLQSGRYIFRNFGLLEFDTYNMGNSNDSPGDFLILNLVTRKKFWMRKVMIASEIIKKTGRLDLSDFQIIRQGNPFGLSQAKWILNHSKADKDEVPVVITMMVERNRHSIEYPTLLG